MERKVKGHKVSRLNLIEQFIASNDWRGARYDILADDASFRKYYRVSLGDRHAVLMDAPPEKEDVRPFLKIAGHLLASGLSAPRILAADEAKGLLLLEDLGNDLFARVLEHHPELEPQLYLAAADVLIRLYQEADKKDYCDVADFTLDKMLQQVSLLPEWFIPLASGEGAGDTAKKTYLDAWREVLGNLPQVKRVMVLYDFHAENIFWLPNRREQARAGLIDFQDATMGSPAYDMVSFLEDARRDVSAETVAKTIGYYLAGTGMPKEDFMAAYSIMGAQRNCRIVGTFARLCVRDGKPRYLKFMPRVWRHVENDLAHPLLAPVKEWLDANVAPEWRGDLKTAA